MLRFRAGQPADVELVLQLWVESEAESTHTDNPESLSALLTHNPGALIVAEIGDRIVGSVIAAWDGWRGSVYRLAVSPSTAARGLRISCCFAPRSAWPSLARSGFRR